METSGLNWIEEIIKNQPKDIKIKKYSENILVKIYTHNATPLIFFAFIFCWVSIFTFFAFYGEKIFRKEIDFNNIFSTFIWLLFPFFSVVLWYKSIYSIFGKVELMFGRKNYIFQGFGGIGIKRNIDWKNILDFFHYYTITDDEPEGSKDFNLRTDYITIKIKKKKTIKISLNYLNSKKIDFLLSIIKYFSDKSNIKENKIIQE
jgi:hypothetical protein